MRNSYWSLKDQERANYRAERNNEGAKAKHRSDCSHDNHDYGRISGSGVRPLLHSHWVLKGSTRPEWQIASIARYLQNWNCFSVTLIMLPALSSQPNLFGPCHMT